MIMETTARAQHQRGLLDLASNEGQQLGLELPGSGTLSNPMAFSMDPAPRYH
jgi:hypothetical protein